MIVKNERGMVLLLVLLVVALLATVLTELSFSTLIDMRLAETFRDTTRANYLARGGLKFGQAILQNDENEFDATDEFWAIGVQQYPVADGDVTIEITDLDGRVALNLLILKDAQGNDVGIDQDIKQRYIKLLTVLDVDQPDLLVDSLEAWLDTEENPDENTYYSSLAEPIQCKNGPLDSLDELALVRGYDQALLKRLRPHVTAHGRPKEGGIAVVNVNTASREVLLSLSDDMDEQTVETLLARRQEEPFTNKSQIEDLVDSVLYGSFSRFIAVKSQRFQIESTGRINDGRTTIQAVVDKKSDKIQFQRVL